jgi:RNA polymerase sigma factor (sigma-70 family)
MSSLDGAPLEFGGRCMNLVPMQTGWPEGEALVHEVDERDLDLEDPYLAVTVASAGDAQDLGRGPTLRITDISGEQLAVWIDAIVDHDERALAALYDATFSRVFGIVQRIVRSSALAEEVVEETYFQVWRQAVRFDVARGTAITWLLSIARSRAIDVLRRESRFRHESLEGDCLPEMAAQAEASDELLDMARHHADLHRALMLLGAQPRQLVSLAFFRGLSHEEIASQTSLPLGTVKSQIRRALQALRQILGEGGFATLVS